MGILIAVFYICCLGFGSVAIIFIFMKLFGEFLDWLFKE